MFFLEAVGDVVFDVEGVEERALLKDHADVGAELEHLALRAWRESGLPKMRISPESGVSRPLASFMMTLLPTPAGPRMMRISPWRTVKEMSLRTGSRSKRDGDVRELDDWGCRARGPDGRGRVRELAMRYLPKMPIMSLVTRKSKRMMSTEQTTTAWVVERPTPWVPPVVRRP